MNPLPLAVIHSTGSQSEVPGPAISASPEYLLEIYILRQPPHPQLNLPIQKLWWTLTQQSVF